MRNEQILVYVSRLCVTHLEYSREKSFDLTKALLSKND
jgi:hypothetical protein